MHVSPLAGYIIFSALIAVIIHFGVASMLYNFFHPPVILQPAPAVQPGNRVINANGGGAIGGGPGGGGTPAGGREKTN